MALWTKLIVLWSVLLLGTLADPSLHKRATQVKLLDFNYQDSTLSGSISVQNIAYEKVVDVFWAAGSDWKSTPIHAQYSNGPDGNGYETWTFSGYAPSASEFYISYEVQGQTYYDPGNYVNYHITPSTTTNPPKPTTTEDSGPVSVSPIPPFYSANVPYEPPASPPSGCNYNGRDSCSGENVYAVPDSAENRRWQTPPKGDPDYVDSFQSYRSLTGYADIQYSSSRTMAAVVVNCLSRTGEELTYSFNGANQSSNVYQADSASTNGGLSITVYGSEGSELKLDPLHFMWENAGINAQSSFENGQKGAIVELFGWPYADVAQECAFLGKAGYMGVKIWPPQEAVDTTYFYEPDGQFRPWYFVYQPVSYRLHSRMGTRDELNSMIQTCRSAGVRVYFDAVINHMSGNGNDIQNHRNNDCYTYFGHNGTAQSPFYTWGQSFLINPFTNTRPTLEFPAVPYGPTDFHCERALNSYNDGQTITKGWLVGLTDLNTEKAYVQDRIASYLVDVLSLGASGFRVDAAKHMGPAAMAEIYNRVRQKLGGELPDDFVTWNEVILGGETDLLACGGGQWSWYTNFNNLLSSAGLSDKDIAKVKIWAADYPTNFPACGYWVIPASRFVIQNDDHDQQSPGPGGREMGDKGSVLIKEQDIDKHRKFEVQLFTRGDADWKIKNVLSSYMFSAEGGNGFPDGLSNCNLRTGNQPEGGCLGIGYDKAFVADACGYSGGRLTPGKYTRVHRDLSIINAMRGWVGLGSTTAEALGIPNCS